MQKYSFRSGFFLEIRCGTAIAGEGYGFIEGVVMFRFSAALFLILAGLLSVAASAEAVNVSPSLEKYLNARFKPNTDSTVGIVVFVDDFAAVSKVNSLNAAPLSKGERHREVVESLKNHKNNLFGSVKNKIEKLYPAVDIKEYWIAPAMAFEFPIGRLNELLDIPGIASVYENGNLELITPVDMSLDVDASEAVRDHLIAMNIPSLWAKGYDGTGSLVCNFDTGVDGDHEALQAKWRGNRASSTACWFAPHIESSVPLDNLGHGTQTMGIMLGHTPADTFGVAPGAEWIAAAVIDQGQTLEKTFSDILDAFEWAIDPDGNPATVDDVPDVIVNSWGVPTTIMNPCDETFNVMIDAVEAAGIVTLFAAGNEGPDPYSLRLPANRAAGPLNSFAVGAIDHTTDIIANFSSRGPSSCDSVSIKPEIVAPGVGIYTSYKNGTYRFTSGTSMATPIIAGLVAIMRQYNPDATVAEIKNALISSCRDLGPAGEDNTYGHGIPDASTVFSYLPTPASPEIHIVRKIVSGDGLADPGETFGLFLRIESSINAFDSLSAYLSTEHNDVTILDEHANFIFAAGSTQTINIDPFGIKFGNSLINGEEVDFNIRFDLPGGVYYDSIICTLTVGTTPGGTMFTHNNGTIEFTISDFGLYGMAQNSIYPAGGNGFRFNGSDNLLYEAGIVVGRSTLQLSSAIRDSLGKAGYPDFTPIQTLTTEYPAIDGGYESKARFIDTESPIPIPITVNQAISTYDGSADDQYIIFKYYLINNSIENITNLHFGFFTDFDLSDTEHGNYLEGLNLYLQQSAEYTIGIKPLTANKGTEMLINISAKETFTQVEKYSLMTASGVNVDNSHSGDVMSLHSFGPFSLAPFDSTEIAIAIAVGNSSEEVEQAINRASQRFNGTTSIDVTTDDDNLPDRFALEQNYPNPFNPTTTISFSIAKSSDVTLDIINTLGQKIVTIYDGKAQPGQYDITWNGTDKNGTPVASGVYFYRLKAGAEYQTRKMVLMK